MADRKHRTPQSEEEQKVRRRERAKQWAREHRDEVNALRRARALTEEQKSRRRERRRQHRHEHRDEINARRRARESTPAQRERKRKEYAKWYAKNREKQRAYCRQWALENRDWIRKYVQQNRETINAWRRKTRQASSAKTARNRAGAKTYYWTKREQVLAEKRLHRREHLDQVIAKERAWYQRKRDEINARCRERHQANPEKNRAHAANRRTRLRGAGGVVTAAELKELLWMWDYRCRYCRKKKQLDFDHVISVVNGGPTIAANLVPACSRCNRSKGHLRDWPIAVPRHDEQPRSRQREAR